MNIIKRLFARWRTAALLSSPEVGEWFREVDSGRARMIRLRVMHALLGARNESMPWDGVAQQRVIEELVCHHRMLAALAEGWVGPPADSSALTEKAERIAVKGRALDALPQGDRALDLEGSWCAGGHDGRTVSWDRLLSNERNLERTLRELRKRAHRDRDRIQAEADPVADGLHARESGDSDGAAGR